MWQSLLGPEELSVIFLEAAAFETRVLYKKGKLESQHTLAA